MKNCISLSLVSVFALHSLSIHADQSDMGSQSIKLESRVLALVDGSFINADTLEVMRSFQRMLVEIMLGKKNEDGQRSGGYECNGKKMCVFELAQYEAQLEEKNTYTPEAYQAKIDELRTAINNAKADFLVKAQKFQQVVGGSKDNLIPLVEESCHKRNRIDSLLMIWANTKQANERALFDQKITSARAFKTFLLDLFHFFGDLVHSCPKAHAQLQLRKNKFNKIKEMLPEILQAGTHNNKELLQKEFLKHVYQMYLDKLSIDDITVTRMQKILKEVRC